MELSELYPEVCRRYADVGFSRLSQFDQFVLAVVEFQVELNNGGIHQYFSNSSGDHLEVLLMALDAIGATRVKELVTRATAVIGDRGYIADRDARNDILFPEDDARNSEMAAFLTPIDHELYEVFADIDECLGVYVSGNLDNRNS
jgi:hypothetical protein